MISQLFSHPKIPHPEKKLREEFLGVMYHVNISSKNMDLACQLVAILISLYFSFLIQDGNALAIFPRPIARTLQHSIRIFHQNSKNKIFRQNSTYTPYLSRGIFVHVRSVQKVKQELPHVYLFLIIAIASRCWPPPCIIYENSHTLRSFPLYLLF